MSKRNNNQSTSPEVAERLESGNLVKAAFHQADVLMNRWQTRELDDECPERYVDGPNGEVLREFTDLDHYTSYDLTVPVTIDGNVGSERYYWSGDRVICIRRYNNNPTSAEKVDLDPIEAPRKVSKLLSKLEKNMRKAERASKRKKIAGFLVGNS